MADTTEQDPYAVARASIGKRFCVTTEDGEEAEGEVVDWKPCRLIDTRTGERKTGSVKLIVRTDAGRHPESMCMAPTH